MIYILRFIWVIAYAVTMPLLFFLGPISCPLCLFIEYIINGCVVVVDNPFWLVLIAHDKFMKIEPKVKEKKKPVNTPKSEKKNMTIGEERKRVKQLLCYLLPHKAQCLVYSPGRMVNGKNEPYYRAILTQKLIELYDKGGINIKPYLRPLSSITKKEITELKEFYGCELNMHKNGKYTIIVHDVFSYDKTKIWFDKKFFDTGYNIDLGLAEEMPKEMYA